MNLAHAECGVGLNTVQKSSREFRLKDWIEHKEHGIIFIFPLDMYTSFEFQDIGVSSFWIHLKTLLLGQSPKCEISKSM